jgi:parallel beta-helix repeat protein
MLKRFIFERRAKMSHPRSYLILSLIITITTIPTKAKANTLEESTSPYITNTEIQTTQQEGQESNVITFSEFPLDTDITNQYANLGIIFGPDNNVPFITTDNATPTSPVLSGRPKYYGAIEGRFVNPNDGVSPMTVSAFSLDAGYFNEIGSTRIEWFGPDTNKIGEQTNSIIGIQHFDINGCYIARWRIAIITNEPAGFVIDNFKCDFGPCGFNKIDDINDDNCVKAGNKITYTISYELGALGDSNIRIIDYLPNEVDYNSSTHDGNYNAFDKTVTWNLGNLNPWATGSVELSVIVNHFVLPGHSIDNIANLVGNSYSRITEEHTFVCYTGGVSPNVILVDNKAINGLNNGTSWDDAFLDFNDALKEAPNYIRDLGSCEIWVAAGQPYKPPYQGTNYWKATFRIPPGNLAIRGHFGGIGRYETSPDQRDFNNPAFETIFDGRVGPTGQKAYYVVTCDDIGAGLILDGFTFTGAANIELLIDHYSDPSVVRCKFNGNSIYGICAYNYSYPDVTDCNFLENGTADIYSNLSSWPYIKNCVFDGNNRNSYGLYGAYSDMLVENCSIKRNSSNGMYFSDSHLTVTGCKIENNGSSGIYCSNSYLEVKGCAIQGNGNDGLRVWSASSPTITNNIICNNKDNGIYTYRVESAVINNNWIYRNGVGDGYPYDYDSGLYLLDSISPPVVRNNTIVGNSYFGIYIPSGRDPCLINDIVWGNGSEPNKNVVSERGIENIVAAYCCIEGGFDGRGNISCDPCFRNPDTNDYHLGRDSNCIDAGDPDFSDFNETDIDGECRIADGDGDGTFIVDIGADEAVYWPKADYNGDLIVNFIDFAFLAADWQKANSTRTLDGDTDVEIDDLKIFCDYWLWIAPWSDMYESLGMSMAVEGEAESAALVTSVDEMSAIAVSRGESLAAVEEPAADEDVTAVEEPFSGFSDEQIQALIDWTQRLWQSDPNIRAMVDPNDYQRLLDSLKEQL